jgi:S-adenosylmethionine:tRNA ribosyltransferase-isomerase
MQTSPATYTLSDFDYDLPPDRVAKYPLPERDQSKMLHLDRATGSLTHLQFPDLLTLLAPGDLLVLNNARVIPARLTGTREGHTGKVELFLLTPESEDNRLWQVLMRPSKRLRPGTTVRFDDSPLTATILERLEEGRGRVELHWPSEESFETVLAHTGQMPIPPYLERAAEAVDTERYQTVFASVSGAQAAPTAGLHFTPTVLAQLKAQGVQIAEVTLNVSAGTFRPVLSELIEDHRMDPEFYTLSADTVTAIRKAKDRGSRVVAVGTTVAKTLETAIRRNPHGLQAKSAWSDLFITPGFDFQVVDALLTNFHLPKSTLLMLVSAFAHRDQILAAYTEAINAEYRFYSYGDCMFIT